MDPAARIADKLGRLACHPSYFCGRGKKRICMYNNDPPNAQQTLLVVPLLGSGSSKHAITTQIAHVVEARWRDSVADSLLQEEQAEMVPKSMKKKRKKKSGPSHQQRVASTFVSQIVTTAKQRVTERTLDASPVSPKSSAASLSPMRSTHLFALPSHLSLEMEKSAISLSPSALVDHHASQSFDDPVEPMNSPRSDYTQVYFNLHQLKFLCFKQKSAHGGFHSKTNAK